MTRTSPTDDIITCPTCDQQIRRVTANDNVSYFDSGLETDLGSRCPFGDQRRMTSLNAGRVSASRPQSTPGGCLKDVVVKIHELHQLERRAYDGAMQANCDCAAIATAELCSTDTSQSIYSWCQAFVTISARLARFMQCKEAPEHKCPACGHACRETPRNSCGLCADCVDSGLTG